MRRMFAAWMGFACASVGWADPVPLPYVNAPTQAVDWTTLSGWTGTATNSTASGYALFDAEGKTLTLALGGAPTELSFNLRGIATVEGTAPASFLIEQSSDGVVWNSTPVADIGDGDLSAATESFGPYPLLGHTRYVRFTYADRYAYDVGLNHVAVGGPAEPRVVFVNREDGFVVAQHAENVTLTAAVVNAGGCWFGSSSMGKEAWESDNGGTFKAEYPKDVYFLNTSTAGTFQATANGRAENTDELVVGTIHFTVAPAHPIEIRTNGNGAASALVEGRRATNAPVGAAVTIRTAPNAGHATDSIVLNGAPVEGATFAMPATAAVVAVSFRPKVAGEPTLILSQYYEGAGDNKWIELFNPGTEPVDLDASGYRLGLWQNAGREGWKTGMAPVVSAVLTGTIAPGATYLVSHRLAAAPTYAAADVATNALIFNGDDSVALYTGAAYDVGNVVDVLGLTGNAAANCSWVRARAVTCGVAADFDSNVWVKVAYSDVDAAEQNVPERLGWHAAGGGAPPAEPPTLTNLTISAAGIAFEIPTNLTGYTVYGAAGLDGGDPAGWAGSSIVDQCTMELADNHTRITVPTTIGRQQMIWLSVPGTN